ncbi:hypothetical protein [Sphingobacterium phlebotomi]|nr:hypothetical protein [Sphingobacterium phlebotomi]
MNKKPIFIVPAYAEVRFPYKRTVSLSGASFKSCAAKTSADGKIKGKYDLTHTSPCVSTARKVRIILTFYFALAFFESPAQIIFGIEMTPSHNPRHQDATIYPTGIGDGTLYASPFWLLTVLVVYFDYILIYNW